jgi:multiple sugar transport system permease protein
MQAAKHDSWNFPAANGLALACAVVLLFAFLFTPWLGTKISSNGARLMADDLYGTAGAEPAPWLWLIPLVAVAGVLVAMWGTLQPERGALTSALVLGLGLLNLVYFANALQPPPSPTQPPPFGAGFWISLVMTVGLVAQIGFATPPANRLFEALPRPAAPPPSRSLPRWVTPYLFLLPPLVLYVVWIIAPTVYTVYLSLTDWDGVTTPHWVGLANFIRLFTVDKVFVEALTNNVRWLVVFITVPTTAGLGMALVFNTEMRGGRFFKVSFYAPLVLSLPVIGLIWGWIYNPQLGILNAFLNLIGVIDTPGWLGDRELAIWCIITAAVWRQVGYVMVLYLAGLKNIDPSLVDAARVDGANRPNLFRYVILPLLAPVTTIIIVISIIDSLRAFDLVSVMTRGGQGTQVLANFMYIEAFNNYRMGYGAAIAVVLFAISLVFIGFYLARVVKDELEY